MKFNVWITLKGPAGTREIPLSSNPLTADSLSMLIGHLSTNLPHADIMGIECVGIRIELVEYQTHT